MKARVYGWVHVSGNHTGTALDWRYTLGEIVDVFDIGNEDVHFNSKGTTYYCNPRQLEFIKEITITDEDFDRIIKDLVYSNSTTRPSQTFESGLYALKCELFKDVK
jgi:hypothetical protein